MKEKARILIIDDEDTIRVAISAFLKSKGYAALQAETAGRGIQMAREHSPDLVLLDMKLPDMDGLDLLSCLRSENELLVVIMVTAFGTIEKAVRALKLGAENFLTKPFDPEAMLILVEHALAIQQLRKQGILNELSARGGDLSQFVSKNARMLRLQELSGIVAADPQVTVLITGETGTGKEVLARWIHKQSDRTGRPFVELNCAGLSKELLESELFGHEKGAFTGAVSAKTGLVEYANGGTLLLDEIGEMEPAIQSKVLGFLENKKFRRLGSIQERYSDVRLLAATNRSLEKMAQEGSFRQDLFYRLNVMSLEIPPLRERKDDIVPLAHFFLEQMARQKSSPLPILTEDAQEALQKYHWPGNIRELKNLMERALILCRAGTIGIEQFPFHHLPPPPKQDPFGELVPLHELEMRYIRHVLSTVDNNYRKAAQVLGINRNTIYNRLREK